MSIIKNLPIERFREAVVSVCAADTAYDSENYRGGTHGHCKAVALAVQIHYQGYILRGKVNGETHFWNKLPGGREVDLTSDQFGGDGINPIGSPIGISYRNDMTNKRFVKFLYRLQETLRNNDWDKPIPIDFEEVDLSEEEKKLIEQLSADVDVAVLV